MAKWTWEGNQLQLSQALCDFNSCFGHTLNPLTVLYLWSWLVLFLGINILKSFVSFIISQIVSRVDKPFCYCKHMFFYVLLNMIIGCKTEGGKSDGSSKIITYSQLIISL